MEEETLQIYEWRIENFSCWNKAIHGEVIKSPKFSLSEYVERIDLNSSYKSPLRILYWMGKSVPSGGNLSLVGLDGALVFTERVKFEKGINCFYLFNGFKEILAKSNKCNRPLIIRLCFLCNKGHVDTVSTTLKMLQISLSIDPKLIASIEPNDSKNISIIHYNERNYLDELLVKATYKNETTELILDLLTKSTYGVLVQCQLNLHNTANNTLVENEEKEFLFKSCKTWTLSNSKRMRELAAENAVTILLNLKIVTGDLTEKNLKSQEPSTVPKRTIHYLDQKPSNIDSDWSNKTSDSLKALSKDLKCLYQDQKFSDLQLRIGNVSFPVHKTILSARSPVFERLLSTDMKEATSGTVDIKDIDVSTMSHFLTFLYTGAIEDLQADSALKLYYAADKYQVPTLQKECSDFLGSNVTLLNVCDILSLAYKHQDSELTSAVCDFILENYNEVLRSEKWRSFVTTEPLLAAEILTEFAAKSAVGKIDH